MLTSIECSGGLLKQKLDVFSGPVESSTTTASPSQIFSLHSDTRKTLLPNEETVISQYKSKTEASEPAKLDPDTDRRVIVSESTSTSVHPAILPVNKELDGAPATKPPPTTNPPPTTKPPSNSNDVIDSSLKSGRLETDKDFADAKDGDMENICSNILSMGIHDNQILENGHAQYVREPVTSQTSERAANTSEEVDYANVRPDLRLGMPNEANKVNLHEIEDDLLSFDSLRLKDPEVTTNTILDFPHASHLSKRSSIRSQYSNADGLTSFDLDSQVIDRNRNLIVSASYFPPAHPDNILKSPEVNDVKYSNFLPGKEKSLLLRRYEGEATGSASDMGESSIISNMLSIDFDRWDESLTSPQNLAKLLGETDKGQGSFGMPSSRKIQNSNQSRFSFAREEEPVRQISDFGQFIDHSEESFKQHSFGHDFSYHEKFVGRNGFPDFSGMESEMFAGSHSHLSSNRISGKILLIVSNMNTLKVSHFIMILCSWTWDITISENF